MKVLIVGAGQVGCFLSQRLCNEGHEVVLAGPDGAPEMGEMLEILRRPFRPRTVWVRRPADGEGERPTDSRSDPDAPVTGRAGVWPRPGP